MNNFLKFKQDFENKPNFKDLLGKDLSINNMVIDDIKLEHRFYKRLKEFFFYFNYESNPKTFNEKIYSKYKLDKLKIITRNDLKSIFPVLYEKIDQEIRKNNSKGFLNTIFFKTLYFLDFDIPNNKQPENSVSMNNPVSWNLFYKILEEHILKIKPDNDDLNTNLKDFSILLETKDLDFKYYQNLYTRTKRNIFYSAMRDLFYSKRDTNSFVLE